MQLTIQGSPKKNDARRAFTQHTITHTFSILLIASQLSVACQNGIAVGSDAGSDKDAVSGDSDGSTNPENVIWSACDDGKSDEACATIQFPADYTNPETSTRYPLRIRRLYRGKSARAQVWLLHGGPGGSAVGEFAGLTFAARDFLPDVSFYALDHRGVGGQTRLVCPGEDPESEAGRAITEVEWSACVPHLKEKWGDTLDQITTSNSARDLERAITLVDDPAPVFLWGESYGAYHALRTLQLFPEVARGIIIEGIAAPNVSITTYSQDVNSIGLDLLKRCQEDATCVARLGPDPVKRYSDVLDAVDGGHCAQLGANRQFFRQFLAALINAGPPYRDLIPALIYRLERCNEGDIAVWSHIYRKLFPADTAADPEDASPSYPLFFHVALSEMWPDAAPSFETAALAEEAYLFTTELTARTAQRADTWPIYPKPKENGVAPVYDGPLLMLQGNLDPATPHFRAEYLAQTYKAPGQHWVLFKDGPHTMVRRSEQDCGLSLLRAFVSDPRGSLDTSCADTATLLDFDGSNAVNQLLFGTSSAWDAE